MRKIFLFFFISSSALFAALPPLAQSSQELQALLADSELHTQLKNKEIIEAVIRVENGYVVMTQDTLLRVEVEYLPQARPGPKAFRFHFYPPVRLKE